VCRASRTCACRRVSSCAVAAARRRELPHDESRSRRITRIDDAAELAEAARTRRDLAIEGYLPLRDRVRAGDFTALDDLHRAAAGLVQDLVPGWRELWRRHPLAQAAVEKADGPVPKYGMCGHLTTWQLH
jgi:hypothetical protein